MKRIIEKNLTMFSVHSLWCWLYSAFCLVSVLLPSLSASLVAVSRSSTGLLSSTSTTTTTTTTQSTTSSTTTTASTLGDGTVTRAQHVIGTVTAELYRRVQPACTVVPCTDTNLSVGLARSVIDCAASCSQTQDCVYYRVVEYDPTPDPRDKLCYLYGLTPSNPYNSFKFLGQV